MIGDLRIDRLIDDRSIARSKSPHRSIIDDDINPQIIDHRSSMIIVGTGVDATEIARVAETIKRFGSRFLNRIYVPDEIAYCRRKRDFAASFAARFAAKEAAMKALGTGHSRGVYWRGIEVVRHQGPPTITFHGGAAARAAQLGATRALLTITHSRELAIAHVILVRD